MQPNPTFYLNPSPLQQNPHIHQKPIKTKLIQKSFHHAFEKPHFHNSGCNISCLKFFVGRKNGADDDGNDNDEKGRRCFCDGFEVFKRKGGEVVLRQASKRGPYSSICSIQTP